MAVYQPVMSAEEITDDGTYLIAAKVGNEYFITNNQTYPFSSNRYWLKGVKVTWDTEADGITDIDAVAAYDWTITNTDNGYLLFGNQMSYSTGGPGLYMFAGGGSDYVSNNNLSGDGADYLGKLNFNTESGIGTAGERAYWALTPDGTGITSFVSKYDRGSGSETYIKFAPNIEEGLFSLADDRSAENLDLVDLMLLKLNK